MGLIRSVITLGVLLFVAFLAYTVPIGDRTLVGHVKQIWATAETQELVDGVKDKSGPVIDRVKRGVKAGVEAAADSPDDGEKKSEDGEKKPEGDDESGEKTAEKSADDK